MKKKIFLITLAACLIVLSIAGTSLAYFTDTDAKTNVFTAGNVDITLTYDEYDDADAKLFPGQTYDNAATIKNVGSESAYVGAIIELTVPTGTDFNTVSAIFDGLNANTVKYVATATGFTVYVVVESELASGGTVDIFTEMSIPADWDNAKMAAFNSLTVNVTAYATQTVGFTSAEEALTTAFNTTAWADYPNA